MDQEVIFEAMLRERAYQDETHGALSENPHSLATWLQIAGGELAEAIAAERVGDAPRALSEALQCATVLLATMEQHGLFERENGLVEE